MPLEAWYRPAWAYKGRSMERPFGCVPRPMDKQGLKSEEESMIRLLGNPIVFFTIICSTCPGELSAQMLCGGNAVSHF
jgi:hypothetical protein